MDGQACGICAPVPEPPDSFLPALFPSLVRRGLATPATMDELVAGWLAETPRPARQRDEDAWAYDAIYDLLSDQPELLLEFIDAVMEAGPDDFQEANLAAGPLEDLLGQHGEAVIDAVELKARREPAFRRLLGGVSGSGMRPDLWRRVRVAANLPVED
jgi:hypothetical protein